MKEEIKQIVANNEASFNYLKFLEELAELTEVLMKRYLKQPQYKPKMSRVAEEMGHVLLRMQIFSAMEGIEEEVNNEKLKKLNKLMAYLETKEFRNV